MSEMRERIDAALEGLEGNTAPARKLLFELAKESRDLRRGREAATSEVALLRAGHAALGVKCAALEDQVRALRERVDRQAGVQAALEGELTALKKPREVRREAVLRGFESWRRRPDLKQIAADMRERVWESITTAMGVKPAPDNPPPDELVYVLLNLGFDEWSLCQTLVGRPLPGTSYTMIARDE
jgi:hypothetical protein